ncbi:hypothetical protein [Nonomuraea sp. NPDC049784]|uniref:hypothetical protein n=1 Tax=Nonomuraea sp. NPDC049784 TaxID=3154361 RepID=UPI00340A7B5F
MFLNIGEARAAVHDGIDHRELAATRRAEYERELRRPTVPGVLLSDGRPSGPAPRALKP